MKAAQFPENETARLDALTEYRILDTPSEKVFDDIAQLAAITCEAPIALISFIDCHRQWFKSAHGFIEVHETTREVSFCAHAILQPELFLLLADLSNGLFESVS